MSLNNALYQRKKVCRLFVFHKIQKNHHNLHNKNGLFSNNNVLKFIILLIFLNRAFILAYCIVWSIT